MITYNFQQVDGLKIFYREAGENNKTTIILFHGFPSASHMFRDLIPILAGKFHVIAPDYPGFGQSESPNHDEFKYTFDHLSFVMEHLLDILGVKKFAMYVFDYGAPIGFRIAVRNPQRVSAIISQNGNIYVEGLGKKWEARKVYWQNPTAEQREQYKSAFAPATIVGQYTFGTEPNTVSPDGYTLDIAYAAAKSDYAEIQSDLIFDYQNNVKLYPEFQKYLRTYQPPLLAIWGKNDPSFIPVGAEAFKKDLPNVEVHFVNSGHFALETHAEEIGRTISTFIPIALTKR